MLLDADHQQFTTISKMFRLVYGALNEYSGKMVKLKIPPLTG